MTPNVRFRQGLTRHDGRVRILAELSCNHGGSLDHALHLIDVAAAHGADAVKFQHYTADQMVAPDDDAVLTSGPWAGRTKRQLYTEAAMPWDWTPRLVQACADAGIAWCSSVYHPEAIAFLEPFDPSCYKIASFELTDTLLVEAVATTGRPVILSTGMATMREIRKALDLLAATSVTVLHCVSAYPTAVADANLSRLTLLRNRLGTDCEALGFSDHTRGSVAACGAVALGATLLEKHLALPADFYTIAPADLQFSATPGEFRAYVEDVRGLEAALRPPSGDVEADSRQFRRAAGAFRGSYASA